MLASERFAELAGSDFHPIGIEGRGRWLVRASCSALCGPRLLRRLGLRSGSPGGAYASEPGP